MALVEVPPAPDMWVHLCPAFAPGVGALGAGLAALAEALLDDAVVDEVLDDACDVDAERVEALAAVSPYASVAPSTAAPAAVPRRGLEILTQVSPFLSPGAAPRSPRNGSR